MNAREYWRLSISRLVQPELPHLCHVQTLHVNLGLKCVARHENRLGYLYCYIAQNMTHALSLTIEPKRWFRPAFCQSINGFFYVSVTGISISIPNGLAFIIVLEIPILSKEDLPCFQQTYIMPSRGLCGRLVITYDTSTVH